ncbi:MAG: DUF4193 family protein [Actinomycetota bacterium]
MSEREEEELEPLEDDDEPVDLESLDDEDDEDEDGVVLDDDDEEETEANLDEILAQRPAARRGSDESDNDDDEDDLLTFSPEPKLGSADPPPSKITPIKEQAEFVCKRCHLVKKRSQLADPKRTLCRDCV